MRRLLHTSDETSMQLSTACIWAVTQIKLTTELLKRFHAHSGAWQSLHEALATIDVLLAFGEFAAGAECATCRPVFVPQGAACHTSWPPSCLEVCRRSGLQPEAQRLVEHWRLFEELRVICNTRLSHAVSQRG